MIINASLPEYSQVKQDMCVVFYFEDKETESFSALKESNAALIDSLLENKVIKSATGHVTPLFGHDNLLAKHVIVVGCGKADAFAEAALIKTVKTVVAEAQKSSVTSLALPIDDIKPNGRTAQWTVEKSTEVVYTSLYKYDSTKSKKNDPAVLAEIVLLANEKNLELAIKTGKSMAHGINVSRELGNLPANICDPDFLAKQAEELADACDEIELQIIEEAEMEELGMGAFLAVSRASEKAGKIIIMKYNGGKEGQAPHVLVGKGLTFDSGGISLKPPAGMEEMKWDMLGAASVMGVMNTLSELRPAINVIGVIAAAENMISGGATRPGDVVTCMNGKTVEIINTDAEGRLVLCDTLTYVERFNPASVIDIATLTGAIVIGLGHHATAVYSNNEELQEKILSAGKASWDRGWPMPLWDEYKPYLDSPYADMKNVGGRAGGSITAAIYLSEYAKAYDWAHLDIAGVGWESAKEGATGRPVAMLTQYLLDRIS
jgi:leucyl aminopeptidase